MARNRRVIQSAEPRDVFDVLRDGHTYGHWVVGTRMIRAVDEGWPQPGKRLHYTAGWWPLRKDDVTTAQAYEPDRRLQLEANAWPAGTAGIVIEAEQVPGGVAVTIDEAPARGLLKTLHNPALDLAVKLRNVETLRRLEQQVRRKQAAGLPRERA
jgi:hypothetical protein